MPSMILKVVADLQLIASSEFTIEVELDEYSCQEVEVNIVVANGRSASGGHQTHRPDGNAKAEFAKENGGIFKSRSVAPHHSSSIMNVAKRDA